MTKPLALAAIAYAMTAAAVPAASIDLASKGLTQGALIASSSQGEIDFDAGFSFFSVTVLDAPVLDGTAVAFGFSPLDVGLDIFEANGLTGAPTYFSGVLEDYDSDSESAIGLFVGEFDGGIFGRLLAELTLPAGTTFPQASAFFIDNVTVSLYEVGSTTVVPLPAAAPLLLAGLGALVATRRRRRS